MALLSGIAIAGPVEIEVTPEQRSALGIELAEVRGVREALARLSVDAREMCAPAYDDHDH